MAKKDPPPPAGAPLWIVTFADLMSLLLCFFVLILSFSVIEVERFRKIAGAMENRFGLVEEAELSQMIELDGSPMATVPRQEQIIVHDQAVSDVPQGGNVDADEDGDGRGREEGSDCTGAVSAWGACLSSEEYEQAKADYEFAANQQKVVRELEQNLQEKINEGLVQVETDGDLTIVRFSNEIAFPSGAAEMRADFKRVIDGVVRVAAQQQGEIAIGGHTDNVPVSGGPWGSNWMLSAARAVAVVEYIESTGLVTPDRLSAEGFGEFRPRANNSTAAGRSENRRVEVILRRPGSGENGTGG